jgi:NAD(P)H-dependent FMN reductase
MKEQDKDQAISGVNNGGKAMQLAVILGSTRPGRHSGKVAEWVAHQAAELEDTEVELLDLRDYPLPLFDEPVSPRFNPDRKPNAVARAWLKKLEEFDAYIIVSPEYNHSTSGC